MKEVTIVVDDKGALSVWLGDRTTGQLCFGEMLEQITHLVHPNLGGVERYTMLTQKQWAERWINPQLNKPVVGEFK